jgi:hypothetical protein
MATATTTVATTTTSTDFDTKLPIYIPRIDTRSLPRSWEREDVVKDFIARQFHELSIGKVQRVDLLKKTDPKGFVFYAAFCHFEEWYDTEEARSLQKDVKDSDSKAKFQFHEKWFWIINENTKPVSDVDAKTNRAVQEHERTIATLKDEVRFLRRQLEARDEQIMHLTSMVDAPTYERRRNRYDDQDDRRMGFRHQDDRDDRRRHHEEDRRRRCQDSNKPRKMFSMVCPVLTDSSGRELM